jgi:hypothetical protein
MAKTGQRSRSRGAQGIQTAKKGLGLPHMLNLYLKPHGFSSINLPRAKEPLTHINVVGNSFIRGYISWPELRLEILFYFPRE